jgi:hypothetical protein
VRDSHLRVVRANEFGPCRAGDQEHPDKNSHPHFVCTACDRVECLDAMKFTAISKGKVSSIGRFTEILLREESANFVTDSAFNNSHQHGHVM